MSVVVKYKILVIDDEKDFCELFEDFISKDFDVETESSPSRALELLKVNNYDLILTDLTLPEIEGLELVIEAKKIAPDRPVVIMSGHDEYHKKVKAALAAGAVKLLQKPFTDWSIIPDALKDCLNVTPRKL